MQTDAIEQIYFSPSGTTKAVVEEVSKAFFGQKNEYNLMWDRIEEETTIPNTTLAIVAMPVFSGRVPDLCAKQLANLKGDKTPAIAIVTYGNREYEDALIELKNILEANGFVLLGAAAVVTQHSIFPMVGTGRPDNQDKRELTKFARQCSQKLRTYPEKPLLEITVKGNVPYREYRNPPFHPTVNDNCTRCGICASICPTAAIPPGDPKTKDTSLCITCTACVAACPEKAQGFHQPEYQAWSEKFAAKNAARKEPEFFL